MSQSRVLRPFGNIQIVSALPNREKRLKHQESCDHILSRPALPSSRHTTYHSKSKEARQSKIIVVCTPFSETPVPLKDMPTRSLLWSGDFERGSEKVKASIFFWHSSGKSTSNIYIYDIQIYILFHHNVQYVILRPGKVRKPRTKSTPESLRKLLTVRSVSKLLVPPTGHGRFSEFPGFGGKLGPCPLVHVLNEPCTGMFDRISCAMTPQ